MKAFSMGMIVIRLFTGSFFKIGIIFVGFGMAMLGISFLRRKAAGDVFDRRKPFVTSGFWVMVTTSVTTITYAKSIQYQSNQHHHHHHHHHSSPPFNIQIKNMSIWSSILASPIFKTAFSLSIWFLLIGIPLLTIITLCYCAVKGTGNVAGLIVDKTTKRVRSYQQQQRKRDKIDPPIGA
ncbi:hypothetical protein BGZ65_007191 [Modicella reniformis]|uniref:Transmembrane protein n=1 Tax=Modicella reniformis TaxID=1440133 RepID=A0A9P6SVG0_9FUNG|nr:hypothetical protein BGZ65_007191 [Modicella reniformis]